MKILKKQNYLFIILILTSIGNLFAKENTKQEHIKKDTSTSFKILENQDKDFPNFNKRINVFGIDIYAVSEVENIKLLHAANVLAQYLDNNQDGKVDNQTVVDKLVEQKALLIIWKDESDFPEEEPEQRAIQDLGNDEINPNYVKNAKIGEFDASLEEVLHLITTHGYAKVYPEVFAEFKGSKIAKAMDIARGGYFKNIPKSYPNKAWYSYDDETCKYNCQISEYHYWALTSILGAQENRLEEIQEEWKLNTLEKVKQKDKRIYKLLTNKKYKFPKELPGGKYKIN